MGGILVFVSHSSTDRKIAGTLAKALRALRMDPFLAHDDIEGGEQWRDAIRKEIEGCRVLVALVTKDFRISEYAGQEVGAAWVLKKPVLPVCVGELTPPGFMADSQRVKYDKDNPFNTAKNVLKFVLPEIYGERAVAVMLERLAKPVSDEEAECLAGLLLAREKDLTTEQLEAVKSAFLYSGNMFTNVDARVRVDKLLRGRRAGKG